jgi:coenzyme PQQ precursor peptide PqqA
VVAIPGAGRRVDGVPPASPTPEQRAILGATLEHFLHLSSKRAADVVVDRKIMKTCSPFSVVSLGTNQHIGLPFRAPAGAQWCRRRPAAASGRSNRDASLSPFRPAINRRRTAMQWIDPAFCDIRLGFEVTAYVYVR